MIDHYLEEEKCAVPQGQRCANHRSGAEQTFESAETQVPFRLTIYSKCYTMYLYLIQVRICGYFCTILQWSKYNTRRKEWTQNFRLLYIY